MPRVPSFPSWLSCIGGDSPSLQTETGLASIQMPYTHQKAKNVSQWLQTASDGVSPLHDACTRGNLEVVKMLVENGANVNAKQNTGPTPLYCACAHSHEDIVRYLIDQGANVQSINNLDGTCELHVAEVPDIVEILLENGADPNIQDKSLRTPLFCRSADKFVPLMKLLLAYGADPNIAHICGLTPLHKASRSSNYEAANLLIQSGADLNAAAKIGYTALHYACEDVDLEMAAFLLKYGASANVSSSATAGITPLHIVSKSCFSGSMVRVMVGLKFKFDIAELLLKNGADANLVSSSGQLPLHTAVYSNEKIAELLIERTADVDLADECGDTALHNACRYEHSSKDTIELLLDRGANVNALNKYNESPLFGTFNFHSDYIPLLMERGASINLANFRGDTPIMVACQWHACNFMEALFTTFTLPQLLDCHEHADVNFINDRGRSAFGELCEPLGYYDGCKQLDVRNFSEKLVFSQRKMFFEMFLLLVRHGLHVDALSFGGPSPYDVWRQIPHSDIRYWSLSTTDDTDLSVLFTLSDELSRRFHLNLKCCCARTIVTHNINYYNLPPTLRLFVQQHQNRKPMNVKRRRIKNCCIL